jgi:hypothetical protein
MCRRWIVPEITNPRAILNEIRDAFDVMMEHGEIHVTPSGVRLNLRGFLGKCDELRAFVCKERQPEEFDWIELKALRLQVRSLKDKLEEAEYDPR